jgi:DNA-binding PadR family transcriptional regulator
MKYTISIDQTHSIAWGLSLSEAAMFSFLYSVPAWAEQIFVDNQVWFFASRNKAIDEMPIISDKSDTVYRLYKSLQTKGVIDWKKFGEKDCIRITEKGKQWNSLNTTLGNKSDDTRKNIRKKTENNPTYNSTKDNTTINNNIECENSFTPPQPKIKNSFARQSIHDSISHEQGFKEKEKVSGQKEKESQEPTETYSAFIAFCQAYENCAKVTLPKNKQGNYIMSAKDGSNCKKLISWIKQIAVVEGTMDEMVAAFTKAAWHVSDKFMKNNFSISMIYSNANAIYTKFHYQNPAAQEKRRLEEIDRLVNEFQP